MAKLDPQLEKWIRWIAVIQDDVTQLVMAKGIFWSVQSLIRTNPAIHTPSIFYWYMGNTYVAYALTGIRRQVKAQKDSITFKRLLTEIVRDSHKVSRRYYRSLYTDPAKSDFAEGHFDRFCAAPGDQHINQGMVQDDLDKLLASAAKCEDLADKRIAHRDKRAPLSLPIFKDADKAIDTLHQLCLEYRLLLLADYQTSLLPTYQYDWQEVFDHAWRRPPSSV